MSANSTILSLALGLDAEAEKFIRELSLGIEIENKPINLEDLIENVLNPPPLFILCGSANVEEATTIIELAQTLRMNYPDAPIFFISSSRKFYNRKDLKKNGYTDAFLLPADAHECTESLRLLSAAVNKTVHYKTVSVVDIAPGTVLGFDVYLHMPKNNKHIRFSSGTKPLDKVRADRLVQHNVNSVHITLDQAQAFYKYTATRLRELGKSGSLTEMREKRERAVRDLMSGLFQESDPTVAFERGKELVSDCKEIVKSYLSAEDGGKQSWYTKLMSNMSSQGTLYNHAANVATYAALFSVGLGIGNPEELAIAGLLHDVGVADIPPEIAVKSEDQRSPEEKIIYAKHVEHSMNIIKERKLIIAENVLKAIEQHHERFDGKGYPNALPGNRISKEAQILAFADYFDYSISSGQSNRTPQQVVQDLYDSLKPENQDLRFDPEFVRNILNLFPRPEGEEQGKAVS